MNQPVSLVKFAQALIKAKMKPGIFAVDATAGNGQDTCFLATLAGLQGKVYAFDIQQNAIDNSRNQLQQSRLLEQVTLILSDHANIGLHIPDYYLGKISVVMFNLGYLPGSDKHIITRPETTIAALNAALDYLSVDGIITILAYPGHPGGGEETVEVAHWCERLSPKHYRLSKYESAKSNAVAPMLFVIEKIGR